MIQSYVAWKTCKWLDIGWPTPCSLWIPSLSCGISKGFLGPLTEATNSLREDAWPLQVIFRSLFVVFPRKKVAETKCNKKRIQKTKYSKWKHNISKKNTSDLRCYIETIQQKYITALYMFRSFLFPAAMWPTCRKAGLPRRAKQRPAAKTPAKHQWLTLFLVAGSWTQELITSGWQRSDSDDSWVALSTNQIQ